MDVQIARRAEQVLMTFADTGCGIEPAFLPHVFEPFRQAEPMMTRSHGGLGIGLAIVKHLVELHGGHVSVQSAGAGRGSTFTVLLPALADIGAAEAPAHARRATSWA